MLWWAIEARALTAADRLVEFYGADGAWDDSGLRENALRLIRRYAAEGTRAGYEACQRLLKTAPPVRQDDALAALERGLAERSVAPGGVGNIGLFDAVAIPYQGSKDRARRFKPLTDGLAHAIAAAWRSAPEDPLRLRLAMRAGVAGASSAVLAGAADPATAPARRCELLRLLAELGDARSLSVAIGLLEAVHPAEVQAAAIELIARHGDDRALAKLLDWGAKAPTALRPRLRAVLLSRPSSARAFLDRVDWGEIAPSEVPLDQLRLVALHDDPELDALVRKHWGAVRAGTAEENLAEMRRLSNDLRAGTGDRDRGKAVFRQHCATCHKLFGEGGDLGPDLSGVARDDSTALLTSLVDPGAVIRAPYLQFAAVTTDGRVVAGLLAARDGAGVTLVDAQGRRTTLPRDEIEELRELSTSMMPEGLLKPLSPQEVRNLFRYLQDRPGRGTAPAAARGEATP
jgi:putative heme-binding domain-containing protein